MKDVVKYYQNINRNSRKSGEEEGVPKLPKIHEVLVHFFFNLEPLEKTREQMLRYIPKWEPKLPKTRRGWGGSNTHLIIDQKTEIAHIICPN